MQNLTQPMNLTKVPRFWSRKRKIFVSVLCIMICIGLCLMLWYLEEEQPFHKLLPPVTTVITPLHSFTLHPHEIHHRGGYGDNTFVQLLNTTHTALNVSDCWICSRFPHHAEKGLQWYVSPLPWEVLCYALMKAVRVLSTTNVTICPDSKDRSAFSDVYEGLGMFRGKAIPGNLTPPYYDVANVPISIPLCFVKTLAQDSSLPCERNYTLSKTDILPYIGGSVYYVCGTHASPWLPDNWEGTCYVAAIFPAVQVLARVDAHRKFGQSRRKERDLGGVVFSERRKRSGTIDQTDTAAEVASDFGKGIIPLLGIALNSRSIRRLSRVLEATINETTNILSNITIELRAVRLMTLQNRMVLDMLLVEKGGVCQILGSQCCVFIPDTSKDVFDAIKRLHVLGDSIHYDVGSWSMSEWFMGLLRGWGWKLLTPLMIIGALILGCCCCIQCFPLLCSSVMSCGTGMVSSIKLPSSLRMPPIDGRQTNAMIMQDEVIDQLMNISYDVTFDRPLPAPPHEIVDDSVFPPTVPDVLPGSVYMPLLFVTSEPEYTEMVPL